MKTRFLLLASCLLAFASQAQEAKVEMWMWKDANGVVHYSDVPGPGAVKVDINVSKGQPGAAPATPDASASASPAPAREAGTYTSLTIVQPANETSYFEADAVVDVQISSDPSLADGDRVYLYLDGRQVGNSGDAQSYSLPSVERGAHSLIAVIFDAQAREKIRSRPVVFYMKQNTIGTPSAMGPLVKPKPKPRPKPQTGG
jgi:hypothetical protein